ncbi:catalase-related domain-containing protein [Actinoplanes sp. NPDC049668]|uniref:catalase-related domain-containing protein n=1 Tax=unclassified Actinoplanes TaxID=2626549 RepID=UPI0033A45523
MDFTNDPLLQGRNFSYLDTQLKRLGGPNFTQLPVNAPRCPVAHFQQDGHMALTNPKGRANYEPNSWPADIGGPREDPANGVTAYPETASGPKRRIRPDSFADHYSQARQFYLNQSQVERGHIADAFVFELSKVDRSDIRSRMVAGLRNVDDDLAARIASGLGLSGLPEPLPAARPTTRGLAPSPALSILANGTRSFAGRKLGVLLTDGADTALLADLRAAAEQNHATVEIIAATVGGIDGGDGNRVAADQKLDGAPSVLYDAVALLLSKDGAAQLARLPVTRDLVTDAYAHGKFIGHVDDAAPLFTAAGLATSKTTASCASATPAGTRRPTSSTGAGNCGTGTA